MPMEVNSLIYSGLCHGEPVHIISHGSDAEDGTECTVYRRGGYGGVKFIVVYTENTDCSECIENAAIATKSAISTSHLPQLSTYRARSPLVQMRLRTVDGEIRLVTEAEPEFPSLPISLCQSAPVLISELQFIRTVDFRIDQVEYRGLFYAFKFHGMDLYGPLFIPGDSDSDSLLKEAELLTTLQSAYIIQPAYIVRDQDNHFRGFLAPYYPAGSLRAVLQQSKAPNAQESVILPTDGPAFKQRKLYLLPKMKMQWATEMAAGVVDLHEQGVFWGDIKLTNVVLKQDGHICLIDVAPVEGWTEEYLAPECLVTRQLNLPRDIFALGLLLWSILEEVADFERQDFDAQVILPWHEQTSVELQDLATSCVCPDPDKRPSASFLLESLRRIGQSNATN
jgi:serine/threonine protein kinase